MHVTKKEFDHVESILCKIYPSYLDFHDGGKLSEVQVNRVIFMLISTCTWCVLY